MNGESSQIQLHKELKEVVDKLNRLEAEISLIAEKMQKKERIPGLDKGLKQLKDGKYHTYASVSELDRAIRKRK